MKNTNILNSAWRKDFPALQNLAKQNTVWLDSAATSQKPNSVIQTITEYYQQGSANIHRAQYPLAQKITNDFEHVRHKVAQFINAATDEQIIFTRSTTESINLLVYGLEANLPNTGNIVISGLEHHANLLPWQRLAQRKGLELVVLPFTTEGVIDLQAAQTLINQQTRLLAVSQMSNVFGTLQPIKQLIQMAKQQGAITVIDGAQGVVHQSTDVQALDCDFYAFSGHKLYAPEGVGVLYGKTEQLNKLHHWQFGGEMVQIATYQTASFYPAPLGFEAGTAAIGSVLGLGAAIDYLNAQDRVAIKNHEQALLTYLINELTQREGVSILGQPDQSLISFYIKGIHPSDLSQLLSEQNIATRAGQHCCMPLYNTLGLNGSIRVSLALYNNQDDIQQFLIALDKAVELLA
ncbi:aminotransferase class V-fold PLP-dependent enzyme [Entomomonas asaccharolytica]|uniref:Cysteine desulfurase n=1 Tax=Entomomonas asaccharolytica TaxID=2785331 RepID=A0A974RWW2_9GAMM|nr:SufS family cysteine desulfurase [Entomomonas asaccharolytica]QQP85580.1 SufS family cysteine desulfurase [Entomomonas asaccharolytica]